MEMSIARQWLGKHIPFAVDVQTTINKLLKAVFSAIQPEVIYLFYWHSLLKMSYLRKCNSDFLVGCVSHYTALAEFLACLFHLLMKLKPCECKEYQVFTTMVPLSVLIVFILLL
jgi:hypothetical protein